MQNKHCQKSQTYVSTITIRGVYFFQVYFSQTFFCVANLLPFLVHFVLPTEIKTPYLLQVLASQRNGSSRFIFCAP